ncbi:ABC transporter substrate-binding protein [Sulfitobacter guttiformis]|uniref:Putative hydroxymethylpyrimidine transport system substrate-binding protein n=1 Tax=Sulfitobacter guttiformis TaxID=74349 RepID=A0A420DQF6_9RHOB|nr:ABC transporter substrate-binding protein [Sulfitobacter guttiformis]KIN73909.1 NMT1/THI5 like family [Sulfitobacter guttiformis KCTC 32187]RKE96541.1 putative hydroxymethylpyrimidine transport system substrate-binding protein [Sulfitobacter guttiformis]
MKHFLAALTLTLTTTPAFAQDKMTIMLDWFVNPNHGPIIIAQEKGYFAEANLEIEVITPADPNDPPRMAAAGRVDLAVSYQPELHLNARDGLGLVRVGTLIETPMTCLVVRGDGPVESVADLAGRKVGFAVAGLQEMLLDAMLLHNGVDPSEVEQINIGWSISPALMSGQVDGVIGAFRNFELNQMDLEGIEGRCFYPEAEGVPSYDELIYVARADTLEPEKIARFLQATERAVADILNDPQGMAEVFFSTSAELRNELNVRAWADTWPRFASRPAAVDHGRYNRFEAFLLDQGSIDALIPASDLVVDVTAAVPE